MPSKRLYQATEAINAATMMALNDVSGPLLAAVQTTMGQVVEQMTKDGYGPESRRVPIIKVTFECVGEK